MANESIEITQSESINLFSGKKFRTSILHNFYLIIFTVISAVIFLCILAASIYCFIGSILLAFQVHLPYMPDEYNQVFFTVSALPALVIAGGFWGLLTVGKETLPAGVYLTEENGHSLIAAVQKVADRFGVRAPDKIVLTAETNAFAGEFSDQGLFRRKTRVLGLGLPLLALLSPRQSQAVIAHEMGHFIGRDNIPRAMNRSMMTVASGILEANEGAEGTFWLFIRVFSIPVVIYMKLATLLEAYVSRVNEYAADHAEVEQFGAANSADSLVALHILGDSFDQALMKPISDAWTNGAPLPNSLLCSFEDVAKEALDNPNLQQRLEKAIAERTSIWASHPCLKDRLAAIGVKPSLPKFNRDEIGNCRGILTEREETLIRRDLENILREQLSERFEERRQDVLATKKLIKQVYHNLAQEADPHFSAEAISLLLEQKIPLKDSCRLHQMLTDQFGYIASSAADLALMETMNEDIHGVERLLQLFETDPMMNGEVRDFLACLFQQRTSPSAEFEWLQDWITSETIEARFEAAWDNYLAIEKRALEQMGSMRFTVRQRPIPQWFLDYIIADVHKYLDPKKIWFAQEYAPDDIKTPIYRLLIETSEEVVWKQELPNATFSLPVPGLLSSMMGNTMDISELGGWNKFRNEPWAIIYDEKNR